MSYSLPHLTVCVLLYAFFGWLCETVCIAVKEHRFANRGLLNLPLILSHGITAVLVSLALPDMPNLPLQYLLCLIVMRVVQLLCDWILQTLCGRQRIAAAYAHSLPLPLRWGLYGVLAGAFLAVGLVVHPLVYTTLSLFPRSLVIAAAVIGMVWVALDFASVLCSLGTGRLTAAEERRRARTDHFSTRIARSVRSRLDAAYPGILTPDPSDDGDQTFARGICFDKLMWVFLISAFLGALIEMAYCYAIDGFLMNRSSLLYGAFSVVWGVGAVVLTVALQGIADQPDRRVFLAGFFIGGAYEYLCSVFTEIVFGRVFWDYSSLPLNIGGRTNVVYCIFWGILAVVWIKVLYPKLSDLIQLFPPVQGKLLTWALVIIMGCNCVLTAAAMVRYDLRQTDADTPNAIEAFLDERYDDVFMEHRWPNMRQTAP